MSLEDSGVIDLFALKSRAAASPAQARVPPDIFSAPPPAFTTDLGDDASAASLDDLANPFAKPPRKKLVMIAGVAGALVFLGIVAASLGGGGAAPAKAAAAKVEPAPPPPAATIPPPPVIIAAVAPSVAAAVPAPPTTGAAAFLKAPSRAGAGRPAASKPRASAGGGIKLTKVQSTGVAGH